MIRNYGEFRIFQKSLCSVCLLSNFSYFSNQEKKNFFFNSNRTEFSLFERGALTMFRRDGCSAISKRKKDKHHISFCLDLKPQDNVNEMILLWNHFVCLFDSRSLLSFASSYVRGFFLFFCHWLRREEPTNENLMISEQTQMNESFINDSSRKG